jgi:formylmethanofuran dehydrogenase subunit E
MTIEQLPEISVTGRLATLLDASATMHHHLCPRQVLGVRMGLLAGSLLGVDLPQAGKRLLAIVETDGCLTSGLAVALNCWVNHRTMRIEDYGRVAATVIDTATGRAIRLAPRPTARSLAVARSPEAASAWQAMLLGYRRLSDDELLVTQRVTLATPLDELVSHPGRRVNCAVCGEEIINGREVMRGGEVSCRACAGPAYYRIADFALPEPERRSEPSLLVTRADFDAG